MSMKIRGFRDIPMMILTTTFAGGCVMAVARREGEMPPEFYPTPMPVAQLSVMASTSLTATTIFSSIVR